MSLVKTLVKTTIAALTVAGLTSCGAPQQNAAELKGTPLEFRGCGTGSEERNDGTLYNMEQEIVRQVNELRAQNGLRALRQHGCISVVAYMHSRNMAKQNNASHVLDGLDVGGRLTREDINHSWWGENIQNQWATRNGQPVWDSAAYPGQAMGFWKNSPGHRANMLNPNYDYIGVGISKTQVGDKGYFYATQVFMTE